MSDLKFIPVNISKHTNAVYGKGKYKGNEIWFSDFDQKAACRLKNASKQVSYKGKSSFRNIPFSLSCDRTGRPRMILVGGKNLRQKGWNDSITLDLKGTCDSIIFATSVDCPGWGVRNHGKPVADAVLTYKDGSSEHIPFRLFFETAPVTWQWGAEPFRSWSSRGTEWIDPAQTYANCTNTASRTGAVPLCEWLFPWENPVPLKPLKTIEIISTGEFNFALIGITLQKGRGNPLKRAPKKKVLIEGPQGVSLDVHAERGQVFRKRYTKGDKGRKWLNEKIKGRGDFERNAPTSKLFADILTASDETITVKLSKNNTIKKHTFSSADIDTGKKLKKGTVSIRKLNTDERYVQVAMVDETGKPVGARVHFCDSGGRYLPPAGHPEMPRTEWIIQTGCDCVYNGTPYAYVNGDFSIRLPQGEIYVEAVKGFEYEILRKKIKPAGNRITLKLKRITNEKKKGYYTADTHVHFISPTSALLESEAEDVDVTNILASQWGDLFTNTWDYTGGLSKISTRDNLIFVSQENRQHTMGHISLLGLEDPVYPFCTGDPDEAELGAELENVIAEWCEKTRTQGGLSVIPHFPMPICENASLILNDLVDAVELGGRMKNEPLNLYSYYYHFLNLGKRVPVVGGTDKMSNITILGSFRTYAYLGKGQPLTYTRWKEAVRKGRTYSTSGPRLYFSADGKHLGDTISLGKNGGTIQVKAAAESIYPFDHLEIILNSRTVLRSRAVYSNGLWKGCIQDKIKVNGSGWLALRAGSGKGNFMGTAAHSSPIYIKVKGEEIFDRTSFVYISGLVEGSEYAIREKAALARNADLSYLLRYIDKAKKILHHKLHHQSQHHGH